MPHGAEHVAQWLPLRHVEMDVAGGDQRHVLATRQFREPVEPLLIVAAMVQLGEKITAARINVAVLSDDRRKRTVCSPLPASRAPHTPAISPSLCEAKSSSVRRHAPFSARRRPQVMSRAKRP